MNNEALIQALELELVGYIRRGLTDRARQVQQELLRLGRPTVIFPAADVPSKSESTSTIASGHPMKPSKPSKPTPAPKPAYPAKPPKTGRK